MPVPIDAPTQRPNEPLTAGLPIGAGPGPEVLGQADDFDILLREMYRRVPSSEILELIEMSDRAYPS